MRPEDAARLLATRAVENPLAAAVRARLARPESLEQAVDMAETLVPGTIAAATLGQVREGRNRIAGWLAAARAVGEDTPRGRTPLRARGEAGSSPPPGKTGFESIEPWSSALAGLTNLAPPAAERFRLDRHLRSDAGRDVWAAIDLDLSRPVELHLLEPRTPAGEVVAAVALHARLSGPSFPVLLEAARDPRGRAFLVFPIAPARTLLAAWREISLGPAGAPARRQELVTVLRLARALDSAHRQGVFHGSLAPGVVHLGHRGELVISGWAPPHPGDPTPTPATDVRGLGLLLSFLAYGRPPEGAGETAGTLLEGMPGDLARIVRTATDPVPGNRYPSAGAMADEIERVLAETTIPSTPIGRLRWLAGVAWRHWLVVAGAVLWLILVAVLLALSGIIRPA
ncbi:MAG: hypothetical protein HY720_14050 [Planctomycetes bacterium]|nr:hypothetical protein [Planctomycetota bacterium]